MLKTKTEIKNIIEDSIAYLRERIHINSVYLFGSCASGTAGAWSDIDLAVFSIDADKMKIEDKARLATELRLRCHTEVELHLFSHKALKEARTTNFYGYILQTEEKMLLNTTALSYAILKLRK